MSVLDAIAWIRDEVNPQRSQLGRVLSQPLAARQNRPQHARRELHRRLHLADPRQGRHRHLGDAGAGLSDRSKRDFRRTNRAAASAASRISWYLYSPLRVKYPVHPRGAARPVETSPRRITQDPVDAWKSAGREPRGARSAGSVRAAKAGCGAPTGTPCWRSLRRRWSTRSRSTGPTASPASRRFRRCR